MKILENEPLKKYTTIHIGGTAQFMYIPENVSELISVIDKIGMNNVLGGGSNLLINDRTFDAVINLREFNKKIENLGNGCFKVGASVRIQNLIRIINQEGYGGIEYLYSVPGLVGGAILMNAGGGRNQGWSISDYIVSVEVLHHGQVKQINKMDCRFAYRESIFKMDRSYIVLGATMKFDKGEHIEFRKKCEERLEFCRIYQDNSKPNFGSVFSMFDSYIMRFVQRLGIGNKRVHFSKKTGDWLLNEEQGSFNDAISAIETVEIMHKLMRKKCEREVIIWK